MQLMLQIITPEKTEDLKHVQSHIDLWESKIVALGRDFDEKLSERMKAAILISTLPAELRDAILQNPDKFEKYEPTKERVIAMVEAKLSVRSPDEMEVDCVYPSCYQEDDEEEIQAVGKGGVHCDRCGGQGHIAAKCGAPEPPKWKAKGGSKGDGKGKSKGKGKGKEKGQVEWRGFCSYCGKKGHGPVDSWTKQRDESVGEGGKGARLASLEDENDGDDGINEINGFDIAALDRDETGEWQQVVRRRGHARRSRLPTSAPTYDQDINMVDGDGLNNRERGRITIDSRAAESVIPPDMLQGVPTRPSPGSRAGAHCIAANGARMPNLGEKHVKFRTGEGLSSSVFFQVTQTRKPLASVSKIVKKGNRVVFGTDRSYIETLQTGKQIELTEENGTYHLDVEFYLPWFYGASAESMRLASCEERVSKIFACGDVELGSGEIEVDVEIGDPAKMRADACRGRSPSRGYPRRSRLRSTTPPTCHTDLGASTAFVGEENKQGTRDRRRGRRTQFLRCTWTIVSWGGSPTM